MTNIFKVALPNNDVARARVQDLVIDNRYPNPKINVKANPPHTGIIFLAWNDTTAVADQTTKLIHSFPHGYNSVPTVFASHKFDNGSTIRKGTLPFALGVLGIITIDADIKNVNVKFYSTNVFSNPMPAFTMQIRFYVMVETGFSNE